MRRTRPSPSPAGPLTKDERNERSRALVARYQAGQGALGATAAARRLRSDGHVAIAELVNLNSGLVGAVLGDYNGLSRDEREALNAAGLEGLMAAAEKYDPINGGPFGAYAAAVIRGEMAGALSGTSVIRKPKGSNTVYRIAREVQSALSSELDREPTGPELYTALETELLLQAGGETVMVRRGWRAALNGLERLLATEVVSLVDATGADIELEAGGEDPGDVVAGAVGGSSLWDIAALAGADWPVFCRVHGLDGLGGATVSEAGREMSTSTAEARRALERVRSLLASPTAQWALWAPDVGLRFADSAPADAAPSALLAQALAARV
jgi:hypothetical protein